MTQQLISIGTTPGDNTGDPARTAFDVVNSNFTELYTTLVNTQRVFSVLTYGAIAGGAASTNRAALQAAVDAAEAAGGGIVEIPAGTFSIDAAITVDSGSVHVRGLGINTTIVNCAHSGTDVTAFLFTGNDSTGTLLSYVSLLDLSIQRASLSTAGALVHFNGVAHCKLSRVRLVNGFSALRCGAVLNLIAQDIYAVGNALYGGSATNRHLVVLGTGAAAYAHPSCGNLVFLSSAFANAVAEPVVNASMVYITASDGIWFTGCYFGHGTDVVVLSATDATEQLALVQFNGCHFDNGVDSQLRLTGGTQTMRSVKVTGCEMRANASVNAIRIDASATQLSNLDVVGVNIRTAGQAGVYVAAGRELLFSGCTLIGNSYATVGVSPGYYLENCTKVRIVGGSSGWSMTAGQRRQTYGIELGAGCADVLISGMDLTGNVNGSISGGTNAYRASGCLLENTPLLAETSNLVSYGGMNFDGSTDYLDGNALTGIADGKKGSLVMKVRFSDNAGVAQDMVAIGRLAMRRNASGFWVLQGQNATTSLILNKQTATVTLYAAGAYVIMASWDLAVPNSMKLWINDVEQEMTVGTFTDDTLDYTLTDSSLGATTVGGNKLSGDIYLVWFSATEALDFDDAAVRRRFFDGGGTMNWLGARGEGPTGTIPILFHAYDDYPEWLVERGASSTAYTVNGTPVTATIPAYGYDRDLATHYTNTAAAYTVGRTVKALAVDYAGTCTLTLPDPMTYPNRELSIVTYTANAVVSASSNVIPRTGDAAGTAILDATDGAWAVLCSDGKTWRITQTAKDQLVEAIQVAVSDSTTELVAGTAKATFRMPGAMTLVGARASVSSAPTGANIIVDVNQNGTSVLGTKITIEATETTSLDAASQPTITTSSLTNDAVITIDLDQAGSTWGGAGLIVTLLCTRA